MVHMLWQLPALLLHLLTRWGVMVDPEMLEQASGPEAMHKLQLLAQSRMAVQMLMADEPGLELVGAKGAAGVWWAGR